MNDTGTAPLYLSNNIFKFNASSKLTQEKEFGIAGWHSNIEIIKSRSNRAGQQVALVYNQEFGFDRILSCYQMLKGNGMIHGSGAWFYLEGMPHVKFQQKQFMSKFEDSYEMRYQFKELVKYIGTQQLSGVSLATNDTDLSHADEEAIGEELQNQIFRSLISDELAS